MKTTNCEQCSQCKMTDKSFDCRKPVILRDAEDYDGFYLKLTESQIALINWLKSNNFLDGVSFTKIEEINFEEV